MPSIGPSDTVSVSGTTLIKDLDGTRFSMKGIAFPVPIQPDNYNATNWISILNQLTNSTGDGNLNTVRLYRMDPDVDYSEFFTAAADLGIYVMVPLTAAKGDGDLKREVAAPTCYPHKLFNYGVKCLHNYLRYPNVIAGIVGNEVINTGEAWQAAACVKAYIRDLKAYMDSKVVTTTGAATKSGLLRGGDVLPRRLPLVYATQHSALGAGMNVSEAVKITQDYFTCQEATTGGNSGKYFNFFLDGMRRKDQHSFSNPASATSVDIFGINIESWCSSLDTYDKTEQGDVGTYKTVYNDLKDSPVPLLFTEMGCSHSNYDKANGSGDGKGTRAWTQIDAVLNEMSDKFSGFCAYAYWGNNDFAMFDGGPWDGSSTMLVPTQDFYNFANALKNVTAKEEADRNKNGDEVVMASGGSSRFCSAVETDLMTRFNIPVFPLNKMPVNGKGGYDSAMLLTKAMGSLLALSMFMIFVAKVSRSRSSRAHYKTIPN